MTDRDHDRGDALAARVAEHIKTLPDDERERARAAMDHGEVYARLTDTNHIEVRCGNGADAICVTVHRVTLGPRPDHAADN